MKMTFLSICELANRFYLIVTLSAYLPCEPILQFIIMACITNAAIGLSVGWHNWPNGHVQSICSLSINQSNVFIKPLHQLMSQSAVQKRSLKPQTASNAGVEARWLGKTP